MGRKLGYTEEAGSVLERRIEEVGSRGNWTTWHPSSDNKKRKTL